MADVVCVGILVADLVAYPITTLPDHGKLGLVDHMELHTGGCAVNTATALQKIGIDAAVIGKVGTDALGDFLIAELSARGIDVTGVTRVARHERKKTSSTMVLVSENGERTFIHYVGANGAVRPEDVDWRAVEGAKILHLGGFFLMPGFDGEPAAEVLARARADGLVTSLDTAWDDAGNWMRLLGPCLHHADVLSSSEAEAGMLTGQTGPPAMASALARMGPRTVAIKLGPRGSYISSPEFTGYVPPFEVKAVDGTGAGDAFVAGLLAGLIKGWDMRATGEFANAVGALCVSMPGASAGIRTLDETLSFMAGPARGAGSGQAGSEIG